jgi:hypothetical protein
MNLRDGDTVASIALLEGDIQPQEEEQPAEA